MFDRVWNTPLYPAILDVVAIDLEFWRDNGSITGPVPLMESSRLAEAIIVEDMLWW